MPYYLGTFKDGTLETVIDACSAPGCHSFTGYLPLLVGTGEDGGMGQLFAKAAQQNMPVSSEQFLSRNGSGDQLILFPYLITSFFKEFTV